MPFKRLRTSILFRGHLVVGFSLVAFLSALADPIVIGHPGLQPIDRQTLERIYTGKVVDLSGIRVTPINLPPGNPIREQFLQGYLDQDDAKYIGYWTVRRYVGKGTPPRELKSEQDVIEFVSKQSGAIGYLGQSDSTADLNVIYSQP